MPFKTETITVSELTKQIKLTLEEGFPQISVVGEISNFKPHISGHWYFNLKDSNAVISCTMWKGLNSYISFTPQNGIKVIVNGRITVYPPRGNYQLDVRSMKPAGMGELQAAFERLKKKLEAEGLFDSEHKKPIPSFPSKIGIVTAIDGAAFRDMISVAERRFPIVELIIAPSRVQGSGAGETIAEGIKLLNKKTGIDVIIVGRGGGSIEDLWAFNEEKVARVIYASKIPVITGVGHEIDFTIADFVSDLRAPTPTAAMELATPNAEDLIHFIDEFLYTSTQHISEIVDESKHHIHQILNSYGFRIPMDIVRRNSQNLDSIVYKLFQSIEKILTFRKNKLSILISNLESGNIEKILQKGFVLVKQKSKFVTRAKMFEESEDTTLKFLDGEISIKSKY